MIHIRQYKKEDRGEVVDLIMYIVNDVFNHGWRHNFTSIRNFFYKIFGIKHKNFQDLYRIESEYIDNGGIFYVAENEQEEIIGTAAIKKDSEKEARLKRMFVKKSYRRQGVGQKLLDSALDFAKKQKCKKIVLSTMPPMIEAQRFYEGNGFEKVGRDEKIHYEKLL